MGTTKVCFKCGEPKDSETCFYKHPQMRDGYLNKCKECAKKDVAARRASKPESVREYDRTRQQTPERRKKKRSYECKANEIDPGRRARYQRKWRAGNPEQAKANIALGNALRDGKVVKQPCAVCGATERVQGHHEDYSKPLDVLWLCLDCHSIRHGKLPTRNLLVPF